MVMVAEKRDIDMELVLQADALYDQMDEANARMVAEKLIGQSPDLVNEWVTVHLAALVAEFLGKRWRARSTRSSTAAGAFAEAFQAYTAGNGEALGAFAAPMCVNDDGERVLVRDMTGQHHRYVSNRYARQSRSLQMEAAFHEAVAKRIKDKTTGEVFTEEQYLEMHRSFTKGEK